MGFKKVTIVSVNCIVKKKTFSAYGDSRSLVLNMAKNVYSNWQIGQLKCITLPTLLN